MCDSLHHASQSTPKSRLTYYTIVASVLDFLIQSINAISIALMEELKDALKKDTLYDSEQSMEVKSGNLPGLTSSTKPGGRVLPYMGYIGRCCCEGYGFQAVCSRIGYINQRVWV